MAVTDHRIIHKRGILGRHTIEMVRNKVESVDVVQSFMGRMFNYGTILVRGTGRHFGALPVRRESVAVPQRDYRAIGRSGGRENSARDSFWPLRFAARGPMLVPWAFSPWPRGS